MKKNLLLLTLLSTFALTGCSLFNAGESSSLDTSNQFESSQSSIEDSTSVDSDTSSLTADELLAASESFSIQDYKTLDYSIWMHMQGTSEDGSVTSSGTTDVEMSQRAIFDTTTEGEYYYYYTYTASTSILTDSGEETAVSTEFSIEIRPDSGNYIVSQEYTVSGKTTSSSITDTDTELYDQEIKSTLTSFISSEENIVTTESLESIMDSLTDPVYKRTEGGYLVSGDINFSDSYLFKSIYMTSTGEITTTFYSDALMYSEVGFNEYGHITSRVENVYESIEYSTTADFGTTEATAEGTIDAMDTILNIAYDEEVDTSAKVIVE